MNLKAHTWDDPRIRPRYAEVSGWVPNGIIERLPLLPTGVKGRARAVVQAAAFGALPRPDVIWTSVGSLLSLHLWAQLGPLRRPVVLELDWTLEQQEAMAPFYFGRPPRYGPSRRMATVQERLTWRHATLFTTMSRWAADSLRRQGIEEERIRVIPPGVNLDVWQIRAPAKVGRDGPLRLLFVGGDFARKGGPELIEVLRRCFAGRCVLDVVTHDAVPEALDVRVHRAEPNSPLLQQLYAEADLFVMPSKADCLGHATVEAMACGLPVIVGDVGGARDIVDPGETGWLIEPQPRALAASIEDALVRRGDLPTMGRRARRVVEQRFDGRRNDARVVDAILEASRLPPRQLRPLLSI